MPKIILSQSKREKCSIAGCSNHITVRKMCPKHYQRFINHGDVSINLTMRGDPIIDRFQCSINKTDYCWIWTGSMQTNGYGRIFYDGKDHKAHRVSYELNIGHIPKGMIICHKCDNPSCVNPDHLFLGTNQDNSIDMVQKGRNNIESRSGDNHWMKKHPDKIAKGSSLNKSCLTEDNVIKLRKEFSSGATQVALAKKYGTTNKNIFHIVHRKTWKHI